MNFKMMHSTPAADLSTWGLPRRKTAITRSWWRGFHAGWAAGFLCAVLLSFAVHWWLS